MYRCHNLPHSNIFISLQIKSSLSHMQNIFMYNILVFVNEKNWEFILEMRRFI